ncbi:unnamed protein product [Sympodiomycopsis kandeliae]
MKELKAVISLADEGETDVFAADTEEGPAFRSVSVPGACALVIKTQFGLGVLGLPGAFHILGIVPALLVLLVLSVMITWTGLTVGNFRLRHPAVYGIDDAAFLLFGKAGREVMGFILWLFYSLSFGSACLALSVAFNSFTSHAACTVAWAGMIFGISLFLAVTLRSLKSLLGFGYVGVASIFFAIWVTTIACCVRDRPAGAPLTGPYDTMFRAFSDETFPAAISAVSSIFFAIAGTASFFTIHAEMKEPEKWHIPIFVGQGFVVLNYLIVASLVYSRVGVYVTSPALGSAGKLIEQIAYGLALPGLFFSAMFQIHVAGKWMFVRILRDTVHLQKSTLIHWITWGGSMMLSGSIGFIIAEVIPIFNDLVGLIGALFGTILCLVVPSLMYIFDKGLTLVKSQDPSYTSRTFSNKPLQWVTLGLKGQRGSLWGQIKIHLAILTFVLGLFLCISATYGTIVNIINNVNEGKTNSVFSCADNSFEAPSS